MIGFWNRIGDELIANGLAAIILFIVLYGLYRLAKPIINAFIQSIKAQTDANMEFAKSVTRLAEELSQFTTTNIDMFKNLSQQIKESTTEIISHIKNKP